MDSKPARSAWIVGPASPCPPRPPSDRPLRVVLLGAPGVGKGTQAELLAARHGACHLSTGDVLRAAKSSDASRRTPALAEAIASMIRGELVPDSTMVALVKERRGCFPCPGGGFILDGFPRTVAQAIAFDALLEAQRVPLEMVVNLEMPLDELVVRVTGRRTCPHCKTVYHVLARPPARVGVCDGCGTNLVEREDDRPEAVLVRMRAYEESTAPLVGYYADRGLLLSVSALGTPGDVHARVLSAVADRLAAEPAPPHLVRPSGKR